MTSHAFSAGKDFSAGGLRHWAYRLGKTRKTAQTPSSVRMARVIRVPAAIVPVPEYAPIVVEHGTVRIALRAGFDRAALHLVLDVLDARAAR